MTRRMDDLQAGVAKRNDFLVEEEVINWRQPRFKIPLPACGGVSPFDKGDWGPVG